MLEKLNLSDQRIVDCLNIYYGIQVVALNFLQLGADVNAAVYKAEAQDNSSYFIKLKIGHHHDISIILVEWLHDAGIQQIIRPLKTINHQSSQRIDDFTLIVYPYIEGENGFKQTLTVEMFC